MTASDAKSPISVLQRKEDCEQSNFERIDMTSQTWWPNMYSRYAKPSIPLHLTSYCCVQIPTPRGVMCTVGVQILKKWACTQTLLHFSFRSFGKHGRSRERGEHASEASEHLLRWRSINSPRFIFYHARSKDFEEKIEDLWGYEEVDKQNFGSWNRFNLFCAAVTTLSRAKTEYTRLQSASIYTETAEKTNLIKCKRNQ